LAVVSIPPKSLQRLGENEVAGEQRFAAEQPVEVVGFRRRMSDGKTGLG
jgi:hypothetical protein